MTWIIVPVNSIYEIIVLHLFICICACVCGHVFEKLVYGAQKTTLIVCFLFLLCGCAR